MIKLFSPSYTILPYCICVPLILVTCGAGQHVSVIYVMYRDISCVHNDRINVIIDNDMI